MRVAYVHDDTDMQGEPTVGEYAFVHRGWRSKVLVVQHWRARVARVNANYRTISTIPKTIRGISFIYSC